MEAVKKMWGINGSGLYVCFCSLATKQRLRVIKLFLLQIVWNFSEILSTDNLHNYFIINDTISTFALRSISAGKLY
jgi:hypothetical protein